MLTAWITIIIRQAGALRWLIVKRDVRHCAGPLLLGGIGWLKRERFYCDRGILREATSLFELSDRRDTFRPRSMRQANTYYS